MAEKKKRRVVRQAKPETVRERAAKASTEQPKTKRSRKTRSRIARPFKALGRFIAGVLRPFRFLLRPFKTKPFRKLGNGLYKLFFVGYFINSWKELKKVQWPNARQTTNLTIAVFLFAIGLTSIVAGTDWVLNKIFREILLP